ncbi:MFS transporter, partial [Actinomadura adrarensis]
LLAVVGLAALCFTLIEGPSYGWDSPAILLTTGAGLAAVAAFVMVERRGRAPMLPGGLFSHRAFSVAVSVGLVFQFVYFGALFIFALYLQEEHGQSTALTAGVMFLPLTVCTAITPMLLTNRIAARHGLRGPMVVGAVLGIPGCLLVLLCDASSPYWLLGVAMGLQGLWSGLTLPPIASLAVTSTPPELAGTGSGVLNAA